MGRAAPADEQPARDPEPQREHHEAGERQVEQRVAAGARAAGVRAQQRRRVAGQVAHEDAGDPVRLGLGEVAGRRRERHPQPVLGDRRIGRVAVRRHSARSGRAAHQDVLAGRQVVAPDLRAQAPRGAVRAPGADGERDVAAVGGQRRGTGVALDGTGHEPGRAVVDIAHVDVGMAVAAEVAGAAREGHEAAVARDARLVGVTGRGRALGAVRARDQRRAAGLERRQVDVREPVVAERGRGVGHRAAVAGELGQIGRAARGVADEPLALGLAVHDPEPVARRRAVAAGVGGLEGDDPPVGRQRRVERGPRRRSGLAVGVAHALVLARREVAHQHRHLADALGQGIGRLRGLERHHVAFGRDDRVVRRARPLGRRAGSAA